jgi:hypothetical protein
MRGLKINLKCTFGNFRNFAFFDLMSTLTRLFCTQYRTQTGIEIKSKSSEESFLNFTTLIAGHFCY